MAKFDLVKQKQEQAQRARFQEQCFLLSNRHEIIKSLKSGPDGKGMLRATTGADKQPERVFDFYHIVALDASSPDTLASQINAIDGAESFFNLDAEILSQLKPIVELHKVYPNLLMTDKTGQSIPYKVPIKLGEGITDSNADLTDGAHKFSSLDSLFRDQGALGNAMPFNFEIRFAGKDIAWVNAIDKFNFSLSLSSFSLFNHVFEEPHPTKDGEKIKWSYKDLISASDKFKMWGEGTEQIVGGKSPDATPAFECAYDYDSPDMDPGKILSSLDELTNATNPEYFEIQAVIRYDPDSINWDSMAETLWDWRAEAPDDFSNEEKLKNFLKNSALVVRLQFKQHKIVYSVGGSGGADTEFILNLEYAAYLENVLKTSDLDLLKLGGTEEVNLAKVERDFLLAKNLLAHVRAKDLTLAEAISSEGAGKPGASNITKSYALLRDRLVKKMDHQGTWMIKMPITARDKVLPLDQIIPSGREVDDNFIAAGARPGQRKQLKYTEKGERLKKDSDDERTEAQIQAGMSLEDYLLAVQRSNAIEVFKELVEQYAKYLARVRRLYQRERYQSFFSDLLGLSRVYKMNVKPEDVGVLKPRSGGRPGRLVAGTAAVAKFRKKQMESAPAGSLQLRIKQIGVAAVSGKIGKDIKALNKALNEKFVKDTGIKGGQLAASELLRDQQDPKHKYKTPIVPKFVWNKNKGGEKLLYFTTFGDILDVAINLATREHNKDATMADRMHDGALMSGHGLFERRLGILLGPLYEDANNRSESRYHNLAHTPIALSTFMGWWVENVTSKERTVYTLGQFIRDLFKGLISRMLGESCIEGGGRKGENIKILTFTSPCIGDEDDPTPPFFPNGHPSKPYKKDEKGSSRAIFWTSANGALFLGKNLRDASPEEKYEEFSHATGDPTTPPRNEVEAVVNYKRPPGALPSLNSWADTMSADETNDISGKLTLIDPNLPLAKQFNYMLIYAHSYDPRNLDPMREKENIRKGIYYLHLGKIKSIVKSASFTRMEIPFWREMNVTGQPTTSGGMMLRDVYDANVTLFGNNAFKVGSHVFLDPTKDGATDWTEWKQLGVGGFYLVTAIEHVLLHRDSVIQETSLRLRYVGAGGCHKQSPVQRDA